MLTSLSCSAPVTALAFLSTPSYSSQILLAGSSTSLIATPLDSTLPLVNRKWTVLKRERVHRIVVGRLQEEEQRWRVLVAGGKEAALVEISVGPVGRR
jgi:hypothetical protein